MNLKETKNIAKLFYTMSEYDEIQEIVDSMINECGFSADQIIMLAEEMKKGSDLFLTELINLTLKTINKNIQP